MSNSYQAYLRRFAASGTGDYRVSNGLLVSRLGEEEFALRWRDLHEAVRARRQIVHDQNTLPILLENALDRLVAELLLPQDFLGIAAPGRLAAA